MPASYRFDFKPNVIKRRIETALSLAQRAAQMLHGTAKFDLDTDCLTSDACRTILIDADTLAGRHLCMLFSGFCRERFTPEDYEITRLSPKVRRELERQPQ